ncbi:hypothetical protein M0813_17881 [Anaeramoeba flamelloides]|uniref:Elongation factor 1 beta central acidic region eukaryote domain-containing protein n=1 Tax=Anaeramoeba flamelloides TaxID=1746091 RepID=A0ABQ8YUD4_9EUKA|nr:hypothetical protein M0813_17881 [Anaeramoeba flamelloides]
MSQRHITPLQQSSTRKRRHPSENFETPNGTLQKVSSVLGSVVRMFGLTPNQNETKKNNQTKNQTQNEKKKKKNNKIQSQQKVRRGFGLDDDEEVFQKVKRKRVGSLRVKKRKNQKRNQTERQTKRKQRISRSQKRNRNRKNPKGTVRYPQTEYNPKHKKQLPLMERKRKPVLNPNFAQYDLRQLEDELSNTYSKKHRSSSRIKERKRYYQKNEDSFGDDEEEDDDDDYLNRKSVKRVSETDTEAEIEEEESDSEEEYANRRSKQKQKMAVRNKKKTKRNPYKKKKKNNQSILKERDFDLSKFENVKKVSQNNLRVRSNKSYQTIGEDYVQVKRSDLKQWLSQYIQYVDETSTQSKQPNLTAQTIVKLLQEFQKPNQESENLRKENNLIEDQNRELRHQLQEIKKVVGEQKSELEKLKNQQRMQRKKKKAQTRSPKKKKKKSSPKKTKKKSTPKKTHAFTSSLNIEKNQKKKFNATPVISPKNDNKEKNLFQNTKKKKTNSIKSNNVSIRSNTPVLSFTPSMGSTSNKKTKTFGNVEEEKKANPIPEKKTFSFGNNKQKNDESKKKTTKSTSVLFGKKDQNGNEPKKAFGTSSLFGTKSKETTNEPKNTFNTSLFGNKDQNVKEPNKKTNTTGLSLFTAKSQPSTGTTTSIKKGGFSFQGSKKTESNGNDDAKKPTNKFTLGTKKNNSSLGLFAKNTNVTEKKESNTEIEKRENNTEIEKKENSNLFATKKKKRANTNLFGKKPKAVEGKKSTPFPSSLKTQNKGGVSFGLKNAQKDESSILDKKIAPKQPNGLFAKKSISTTNDNDEKKKNNTEIENKQNNNLFPIKKKTKPNTNLFGKKPKAGEEKKSTLFPSSLKKNASKKNTVFGLKNAQKDESSILDKKIAPKQPNGLFAKKSISTTNDNDEKNENKKTLKRGFPTKNPLSFGINKEKNDEGQSIKPKLDSGLFANSRKRTTDDSKNSTQLGTSSLFGNKNGNENGTKKAIGTSSLFKKNDQNGNEPKKTFNTSLFGNKDQNVKEPTKKTKPVGLFDKKINKSASVLNSYKDQPFSALFGNANPKKTSSSISNGFDLFTSSKPSEPQTIQEQPTQSSSIDAPLKKHTNLFGRRSNPKPSPSAKKTGSNPFALKKKSNPFALKKKKGLQKKKF